VNNDAGAYWIVGKRVDNIFHLHWIYKINQSINGLVCELQPDDLRCFYYIGLFRCDTCKICPVCHTRIKAAAILHELEEELT
jgi:hypothetical protein